MNANEKRLLIADEHRAWTLLDECVQANTKASAVSAMEAHHEHGKFQPAEHHKRVSVWISESPAAQQDKVLAPRLMPILLFNNIMATVKEQPT